MCCSQRLPDDDPRVIAWAKYKTTEDYTKTVKWISEDKLLSPIMLSHVEGILWGVFIAGYAAREPSTT